jgi:hypothetical protein
MRGRWQRDEEDGPADLFDDAPGTSQTRAMRFSTGRWIIVFFAAVILAPVILILAVGFGYTLVVGQ